MKNNWSVTVASDAMATMPGASLNANLSNLRSYVQKVNMVPMMSLEREADCVKELNSTGSIDAAKELVLSHLRLVAKIAREHSGYGLPQEDLIQEGNIGLMLAVKKFDPSHGVRLAAYAAVWIRSEIQEYILSNWRVVKIGSAKGLRKLFFNLRRLQEELHGLPRLRQKTEIAGLLNVDEIDVERAVQWFAGGDVPLLDSDADQENRTSYQVLLAPEASHPDKAAEANEWNKKLPQKIKIALGSLTPREREIVTSRYLLGDNGLTLAELSKRFSVSIERIRQIEVGALKKMRESDTRLAEFLD